MNDAEIGAVVIGVTQIIKDFGVPKKICPLLAIFLGIAISLLNEMQNGENFLDAALRGILIGTTATGSYSAIDGFLQKNKNIEK